MKEKHELELDDVRNECHRFRPQQARFDTVSSNASVRLGVKRIFLFASLIKTNSSLRVRQPRRSQHPIRALHSGCSGLSAEV